MAEEIKLRARYSVRPAVKQQKGGHNNSGNKHAQRREQPKGAADIARAITRANQCVLVLMANGKTRLMRQADWDAMPH